ncbi:MAG: leucine-rich repeat protein [Eubacterium sp.]|nr:leucine-rich repeat protein [Eubacterium sp.]
MKQIKTIISYLLTAVLVCTALFSAPFNAFAYKASVTSLSDVSTSDWMSTVLDGTRLTEITIPGTHDSCARKFKGEDIFGVTSGISKCQSLNITEQLNSGIRFLDIRCEVDPGSLSVKTVHGTTDCWNGDDYYYLDFVFQDIYNWLDSHPSETVCVCIKEDDGDNGVPKFTNAIYEYIHGYGQGKYFYGENYNYRDRWYLGKSVPTLGEVRGKCVLFNRFDQDIYYEADQGVVADENESGQKIKYGDYSDGSYKEPCYENIYNDNTGVGTVHVQDHYKWNTESKVAATQYMLNLGHWRGEYYINYSSTVSDSSVPNPENLSKKINPSYYSYNYTRNKPSGIYCMDFATADLARQIILNNEAVCAKVSGTDGNIDYTLNRNTGTLTISGSGTMNNYAYTSDVGANGAGSTAPWCDEPKDCLFEGQYNTDQITNIVIEDGITSIGAYAFYGFDHLQSVSIPDSVTSIGEGAFARCTAIKEVDISNTGTTSIGGAAFLGCSALKTFKTADSVATFGEGVFAGCPNLTIYGRLGIPSQTYADENDIPYSRASEFYSVNTTSGNNVKESENPFANRDLSDGVTIHFAKYCKTNDDWNTSLLNFSTGDVNDNRYFIFMGNGAVFFNDGNGGVESGNNGCYFDIRTTGNFNISANKWTDVTVTVYKNDSGNHILDYYADGRLLATYNLSGICASGYPNGVSGNDGVFSFLASEDINLYYGSSYTIYGSMGGTADSFIDDVKLYPYALSKQEIGAFDSSLCYEENFDGTLGGTGTTNQMNDGIPVEYQEYNDGRTGTAFVPFSDDRRGNYIKADLDWSPFVAADTSKGFTVSYFQRVNGTLWQDKETITFAQGSTDECKYFTIGTEGYIRFNNGNGGTDSSLTNAGRYFDHTEQNSALVNHRWQHVTVSIINDYHFKVYVDGVLTADVTVTGASGYANNGGLLNFLASSDTRLYFGSYTPYWGTDTISLDNVKCFDHALSGSEVAALYRYDCESNPVTVFENTFGSSANLDIGGFTEWQYGYGERRGVLHFGSGGANGNMDIYVNGTKTTDTAEIGEYSTIKAVYTGSGSISGWRNTVKNDEGTNVYTAGAGEYEFTLTGDSVVHYVGTQTVNNSDLTAFYAAYSKAQTYSEEDYSAESFANLQAKLNAYQDYSSALQQEQIDDATADILVAISDLVPYLNLTVTAENGAVNTVGGTVLFGDTINLTATADSGYEFFAWYETKTKRLISANPDYSFVITSNTDLKAIFVEQNSAVLRFENTSGQLVKYVAKPVSEWAQISDLSAFAPAVPYSYGYTDGQWRYDGALNALQSGTNATVIPTYTEIGGALPTLPQITDKPAVTLNYQLDSVNNIGSFIMAVNVPEGVTVQSIGTVFKNGAADTFAPAGLDLTINNKTMTSKFEVNDTVSGVYVTNINKLSSRYNWAAKGYVTYYDQSGKLRTAYSNQINIVERQPL